MGLNAATITNRVGAQVWRITTAKMPSNRELTRMQLRYRRLRRAGLCYMCGRERAEHGRSLCAWCQRRARAYRRYTQQNHQARGECLHCRLPVFQAGRCARHYQLACKRVEARKAHLKAQGLCPNCAKPALPGHVLCRKHLDDANAYNKKRPGRTCRQSPTDQASKSAPPVVSHVFRAWPVNFPWVGEQSRCPPEFSHREPAPTPMSTVRSLCAVKHPPGNISRKNVLLYEGTTAVHSER